jgi:hypothetical protein
VVGAAGAEPKPNRRARKARIEFNTFIGASFQSV